MIPTVRRGPNWSICRVRFAQSDYFTVARHLGGTQQLTTRLKFAWNIRWMCASSIAYSKARARGAGPGTRLRGNGMRQIFIGTDISGAKSRLPAEGEFPYSGPEK
jgi:hypothetical protein